MRIALYCLFLMLPLFVFGQRTKSLDDSQFDFNPFRDRDKKLKEALYPGIVLIQERYAVVDKTGMEFGQNNQAYFSTVYQVAAYTEGGILLPGMANTPGENDPAFEQYEKDYTTKLMELNQRMIGDSTGYTSAELKQYDAANRLLTQTPVKHFSVTGHDGVTEGKLLVFSYEPGANRETAVPKVTVAAIDEIKWENGKADIKDVFVKDGEVIGGVFFNEKIDFATITYELVGFYEVTDNNWYITSIENSKPNSLSPIKKKK